MVESEQMGFPLRPTGVGEHEQRAEDLDSSQRARNHLVAYHLAPAITDFIYRPLVVSNPIDKKGSEFMCRSMRWEVPSMH